MDDGLLEVGEIRSLRLNAELVTLSACDTGAGPVGESDVANLVNAFIEAGSKAVVSSQWEVKDRTAEKLMSSFYGSLASGRATAEALRESQLMLEQSGLPPYYWAGFEVAGDPAGTL